MVSAIDQESTVWRVSSYCVAGSSCVEIANFPDSVWVRDSKDPDGPRLAFSLAEWHIFISAVRKDHVTL